MNRHCRSLIRTIELPMKGYPFDLVGDDVRSPFGIDSLIQKWTRDLVPYNSPMVEPHKSLLASQFSPTFRPD
jgi:hypothetical protein